MTIRRILIILLAVVAAGCGSRKAEHFAALPFPDVMPPAMISGQQEAAEYMAEHWWDNITDPARTYPCDSSLVSGVKKEDIEQKFANWIHHTYRRLAVAATSSTAQITYNGNQVMC